MSDQTHLLERERGLEPLTLCLGIRSGPIQVPIRLRPLVSARAYLIGPGGDSVVPETSATDPLRPSAWLQFGYSRRRLFCSPRQEHVKLGRRLAPHVLHDMGAWIPGAATNRHRAYWPTEP